MHSPGTTLLHEPDHNIVHHSKMLHEKFDQPQIWDNSTQHVATPHSRVAKCAQHVAPKNGALCYIEMLQFSWGLKPGLKIATYQDNIPQHCWPNICKLRPNGRNISTQHIAALFGATCCACVRLATLLRRVAICWVLKSKLVYMPGRNIVARTWPNDHSIMQHPRMFHEKSDHFQIWASKPNMLQHVATVWPNECIMLRTSMLRYTVLKYCDRLIGACHSLFGFTFDWITKLL